MLAILFHSPTVPLREEIQRYVLMFIFLSFLTLVFHLPFSYWSWLRKLLERGSGMGCKSGENRMKGIWNHWWVSAFEILSQADWVPLTLLNSPDLDLVTKSKAIFLGFNQQDTSLVAVSLKAAFDSSSELAFHLTFVMLQGGMAFFLLLILLVSLEVFGSVTWQLIFSSKNQFQSNITQSRCLYSSTWSSFSINSAQVTGG